MPIFNRGDVQIHYEEQGQGFPVLLIAPGGMKSTISAWERAPWSPIDHLVSKYRVIAMDQRNGGGSSAPVHANDGWHVYTQDQLGLLDHLGIDRFHVLGMCIGGPYALGLIETAPERVVATVILQTIGLYNNRHKFFDMFDTWAAEVAVKQPIVPKEAWERFKTAMFGGDFLFNSSREFIGSCKTPFLVMMGADENHPEGASRELAELAPNAVLVEKWKQPEHNAAAKLAIDDFLDKHTPN